MRVLVAETLDPDGALVRWLSPDLSALGHQALPLPIQELAPLLGANGLAAWIEAVCESFRPDLVIVCPPYDHAPATTWQRCRDLGARVVGFAMDEPLFSAARAHPAIAARYAAAVQAFDRLYVTSPEAAADLAARGLPARWLRWALSPGGQDAPLNTSSPGTTPLSRESGASRAPLLPAHLAARLPTAAVLVGRPYARRIALLRDLAEHVPVLVFGHGWDGLRQGELGPASAHGPLTGPAMQAVLAQAGVVVTTGDWEARPIPMVKVRLLEAAFAGAVQVAQRSPDLAAYFPPDEVPCFDAASDLAPLCQRLLADPLSARAAAARATARAHAEHTWRVRFHELAADLAIAPLGSGAPPLPPPPAWRAVIAAAAADAERRAAHRLAVTLYAACGDLMGEARALLPIDPRAAAARAQLAITARDSTVASSVGLYVRLPTPAPALGHVGFLDPTPELEAIHITALLEAGDLSAAATAVAALIARDDPDRLVATAAILEDDGHPAHAVLWRALFSAALAATPHDRDLQDQHRARFSASSA